MDCYYFQPKCSHGKLQNMQIIEFKLVLVGDPGVGKTTFIKRNTMSEFELKNVGDQNYEISTFIVTTNFGDIKFKLWATAGNQKSGELSDEFYIGAHGAIIMFDLTSRESYKNTPNWHRDINKITEFIPIVMVGNKIDVKDRKVKARQITYHRKKNLAYFDVSSLSNYQYQKPFLHILRKLVGDPSLSIDSGFMLHPPEINIDQTQMLQIINQNAYAERIQFEQQHDEDDL